MNLGSDSILARVMLLAGLLSMSCSSSSDSSTEATESGPCAVFDTPNDDGTYCACYKDGNYYTPGITECAAEFESHGDVRCLADHDSCKCGIYGCEDYGSFCSCDVGLYVGSSASCVQTAEWPHCCRTSTGCECGGMACSSPDEEVPTCALNGGSIPISPGLDGCLLEVSSCDANFPRQSNCDIFSGTGSGGSVGTGGSGGSSGSGTGGSGGSTSGGLCTPKGGTCEDSGDCACGEGCLKLSSCESCSMYCVKPCETDQECVDWSKGLTPESQYTHCDLGGLFGVCE